MLSERIQGQPKALRLLRRALENKRLAHAYLFSGPEGVGKATAAKAMAAVLFCRQDMHSAPCGTCPGCLKFAGGNHPDFLHVIPQGAAIKIDQVREVKKTLGFPPLEAGSRIILIEDVHTMRREAANSLLKLLEEPPPGNILLLTADEAEPLLPTILSRCQVIPFYPLPLETAAEIIRQQNPELDQTKSIMLATLTNGCPGLSLAINGEEVVRLRQEIIDLLLRQEENDGEAIESALLLAARAAELKDGLDYLFNLLRLFFKQTMVALMRADSRKPHSLEPDPEIGRARERWNLTELSDKVEAVDFADKALARNCNRGLVCEVLLTHLLDAGCFTDAISR